MKTITAKQLRDDLEEIVDSVRLGQSFSVSYRSRPAFKIVPSDNNKKIVPGSPEAMKNVMKIVARNKEPRTEVRGISALLLTQD